MKGERIPRLLLGARWGWLAAAGLFLGTPGDAWAQRPLPEPRISCYAGYLAREAPHGLEGVRAAVRQALGSGDEAVLRFLGERLAEAVGTKADAALQVVEWARTAQGAELTLYLGALREAEAVRTPAVVEQLVRMAETHADAGHRGLALGALETQHRLEPAVLERLVALAKQDGLDVGLALQTVKTIGRVMETDFRKTGRLEPSMGRLLEVALDSPEAKVRSLAVEMGTYPDARVEGASLARVMKLHAEDADAGVREMAALLMSSGRDTQAVLEAFRQSFPKEKDRCVRWAILRYAVRAGGAGALPLIEDFARQDTRFQRDVREFKALYGSGQVDFNRVWQGKGIHHRC